MDGVTQGTSASELRLTGSDLANAPVALTENDEGDRPLAGVTTPLTKSLAMEITKTTETTELEKPNNHEGQKDRNETSDGVTSNKDCRTSNVSSNSTVIS